MIKVAYDAGHGFNTSGKRTPDGEREWTFNDIVARSFAKELEKYNGITLKRFDDTSGKTDVSLNARTNGANSWGAHYFFSFHHNALAGKWGTHTGVETFVYTGHKSKTAGKIAAAVHPAVVKAYGLRDRGIKEGNLHIVRETKMPAVLIEGGFMDSTIDIKKLRDKAVLENAGKMIGEAFAKFAGLKKKETPTEIDQPKPTVSEFAKEAHEWVVKQGISDGSRPNDNVTREEVWTMLHRLANKK